MDLTQYKKAWENQPESENKLSALEIYKLTQSKSSSIVKWIFIIGIAEFVFWFLVNFISAKYGALEPYEKLGIMWFMNYSSYFHYAVIIIFLVLFYRNFNSISVVDNTRRLMINILRTRRTVKWYVIYNLLSVIILSVILSIFIYNSPGSFQEFYGYENNVNISESQFMTIMILSQIFVIIIMLVFLGLLYYLLYGILLKKLNRNYKELSKLEEE